MVAPTQQPSLMGQMAATAGGVAIGSAVGHTVGHALTGLFSGGTNEMAKDSVGSNSTSDGVNSSAEHPKAACAWEIKQFIECAEYQSDLSLCQGFKEALCQCKAANGKFTLVFS